MCNIRLEYLHSCVCNLYMDYQLPYIYIHTYTHTHSHGHTYIHQYITFPFHSLRARCIPTHFYAKTKINLHRKLRHRFISLFADSVDLPKLLPNVHVTWLEASQPSLHIVAFSFFLRFPLGLGVHSSH